VVPPVVPSLVPSLRVEAVRVEVVDRAGPRWGLDITPKFDVERGPKKTEK